MRVAQVARRERAESIPAGSAVLLAMDVRPDHRAFLRTAGSLLSEALTHLGAVGWAQMRNDNLDLALAWTAHELRGPLVGARAALGHVHIDDQGPKSGELLQQTRDELGAARGSGGSVAAVVGRLQLAPHAAGRPGPRGRRGGRVVPHGVRPTRIWWCGRRTRSRSGPTPGSCGGRSRTWSATRSPTRRAGRRSRSTWTPTARRARVRVRDRGPGVPAAERHLIFDPFARGRLAGETRCGKGLGALHRPTDRRGARRVASVCDPPDRGRSSASSCRSRPGGGSDPRPDRRRPSPLRGGDPRHPHRHGDDGRRHRHDRR